MCELLGMSSNHRTTINLSLTALSERGENPRLHGDGWGVAFYEGKDVRLIKDHREAKNSPWVELIKNQQIRSHEVIAHIRKGTMGEVSYRNTHPFVRELKGRVHTFAHNGTLKTIFQQEELSPRNFFPVGTTDSEYAFCHLMDRMKDLWEMRKELPSLDERLKVVSEFATVMRELGPVNFLYSDGETLFAHGHRRHDPLINKIVWPGLHYIQLNCRTEDNIYHAEQGGVTLEGNQDIVTLFASVPLNEDNWVPLLEGQILAVTRGQIRTHFSGKKLQGPEASAAPLL